MIWPFGSRKRAINMEKMQTTTERLEKQIEQLSMVVDRQSTDLVAMKELLQRQLDEQNARAVHQESVVTDLVERLRSHIGERLDDQLEHLDDLMELSVKQQRDGELLSRSLRVHIAMADDVFRALHHGEDDGPWASVLQQWQKVLDSVLAEIGVGIIDPQGELFDSRIAEAQGVISPAEAAVRMETIKMVPPFTVVETLRRGYRWRGTLLQKALVITVREEEGYE